MMPSKQSFLIIVTALLGLACVLFVQRRLEMRHLSGGWIRSAEGRNAPDKIRIKAEDGRFVAVFPTERPIDPIETISLDLDGQQHDWGAPDGSAYFESGPITSYSATMNGSAVVLRKVLRDSGAGVPFVQTERWELEDGGSDLHVFGDGVDVHYKRTSFGSGLFDGAP